MPGKETIIAAAEREADSAQRYYWAPMSLGILTWLQGGIEVGQIGQTEETAICCFDYFVLLAIRHGLLNKGTVQTIYNQLRDEKANRKAGALSYWGYKLSVWQDWPAFPRGSWRPRRGDLVFFNAMVGGDLNHVVLATGKQTLAGRAEVISFGERLERSQVAAVGRTTIEELRQAGHATVKFTQPIWS